MSVASGRKISLLSLLSVSFFIAGCATASGDGDLLTDTADIIGIDVVTDVPQDNVSGDPGRDLPETIQDVGPDGATDVAVDLVQADVPEPVCRTASTWDSTNTVDRVFTDVTAESGLLEMNVRGIRAGTVDFDGDGLPDLVTRNVSQRRDDFSDPGTHYTWLLRNAGGFTFEDVTESSGFTATRDEVPAQGRVSHVVVWGDVDNDGDLDAFSGRSMTSKPNTDNGEDINDRAELLLNNGDGTFSLAPATGFNWVTYNPSLSDNLQIYDPALGASFLDYDRDGNLDLFVGYAMYGSTFVQDSLFKGDGAGGFVNVTEEAGLKLPVPIFPETADVNYKNGNAVRNTWGTTVTDLNNDGWPDILCSVYGRYFNALWLGGPDGFTDWSAGSGYASDDRVDWSTNLNAECYCKLEPEAEGCEGVPDPPAYFTCDSTDGLRWNHGTDRKPFRLGGNTFSTVAGDVDNDGDMDLFTFEIVHWDVGDTSDPAELLLNDGSPSPVFSRPGSENIGMARDWDGEIAYNAGDMTGAMFDFDNDGRLDILIASSDYPYTRAFLFHQKADGKFEEVPTSIGIDHPHAHGVAVADYDLDGDLDVIMGHSTARCNYSPEECYQIELEEGGTQFVQQFHAFRNDIGDKGNWLRVRLVGGPGSNRAATGAVVKVTAGGVTQMREVDGGHGHVGIQHEMVQHFGLGDSCVADTVEVRWPDAAGTVEMFHNVRGNYLLTIEQGTGIVQYARPAAR